MNRKVLKVKGNRIKEIDSWHELASAGRVLEVRNMHQTGISEYFAGGAGTTLDKYLFSKNPAVAWQ
jgi:hypothetical protein